MSKYFLRSRRAFRVHCVVATADPVRRGTASVAARRAVSRAPRAARAVSLVPGTMGASLSASLPQRGSDEEPDDALALPGAKKDEEEDAMRGWHDANGGTLTDADAGPVEAIVVSRLRTDASRSRVMDDGRDAPLTVTAYHKRASSTARRPPREGRRGKRDTLAHRAERGDLVAEPR